MKDGWRERLLKIIDADERADRVISRAAGLGVNFISQMRGTQSQAPRQPSIEHVRKLAHALGKDLTTIIGNAEEDAEARLRSALLAYGVDGQNLGRAISAVKLFIRDEQSEPDPLDDQHAPASPRRAREPSQR